jgi:asparagine synthase (glutamine-hydrolysing)
MGGMAGIVHFSDEPVDPADVAPMVDRLAHRGSARGAFHEGGAAFGAVRRALVPTKSVQPLVDGDLMLMMDGWIYDHLAIAQRFGLRDPDVPDTHVALMAWRHWGVDLAEHVAGSFTLAVWDRRARSMHLVRDRMGVRPMFWSLHGRRFAFASELPALLEARFVQRDVAWEHLAEYLSFRVVHSPRTLLRQVWQVEPGHWLRVADGRVETRPYWRPSYAKPGTPPPDDGGVVTGLQQAVDDAVVRRLVPGVPTALYLSGGLGSTAIAAAARRLSFPIPSWTVSFADDPNPETPFAGRVARLLGLEHHEVVIGSRELAASFDDGVRVLGHPVGNPAAFLQGLLAMHVGRTARIVLSGDGGEELFGGRMLDDLPRKLRLARMFEGLPSPARRLAARTLQRTSFGAGIGSSRASDFGLKLGLGGTDLFGVAEREALLRDANLIRADARTEVLGHFYRGIDTDAINGVLNAYLRSWLQEESLVRADRTAAAAGLDMRLPLLDHAVVDRAAALPGSSKLRRVGGSLHTRWPLRAMLEGVLPPPLVNRPKRGMPVPLDAWLASHGRLFLDERCALLRADPHRLFRHEPIERLRQQVGRTPGAGLRLWSLFILDAWLRSLKR